MPRIFLSLSVISLVLILATLIYGLLGGDYNGITQQLLDLQDARAAEDGVRQGTGQNADDRMDALKVQLRPVQRHVRYHILLGILASLVTVLVQSIGVTYFIGTGRWCKEVVDAYGLDASLIDRSNRLKRAAFPFAMLGIAAVIVISALGAAADPGTLMETTSDWVAPHNWAAIIGFGVIAAALWVQASAIRRNQALIESILQHVKEVRQSRGLDV